MPREEIVEAVRSHALPVLATASLMLCCTLVPAIAIWRLLAATHKNSIALEAQRAADKRAAAEQRFAFLTATKLAREKAKEARAKAVENRKQASRSSTRRKGSGGGEKEEKEEQLGYNQAIYVSIQHEVGQEEEDRFFSALFQYI